MVSPPPLELVATGAASPPVELVLVTTDAAAAVPPTVEPGPPGCFGFACLVTWTVRRITLVWTIGLSATCLLGGLPP
jgi:hypothetical protein